MSGGTFEELVKMAPSVEVARVNECLQVLRAPSVAGAEPCVDSPSGAELEAMHQLMGKAQEMGGELGDMGEDGTGEGWWEGVEGEDGDGDTSMGIGGIGGVHSLGNLIFPGGDVFGGHDVFWVNLGVTFIPDELVLTVSKHLGPCSGIEIWEVINTGGNCSEPIIKDNMKLWGDGSSVKVESQRDSTCMIWA